jgi:hypothetical protein
MSYYSEKYIDMKCPEEKVGDDGWASRLMLTSTGNVYVLSLGWLSPRVELVQVKQGGPRRERDVAAGKGNKRPEDRSIHSLH